MKYMKKFFALMLAFAMVLSFAACSAKSNIDTSTDLGRAVNSASDYLYKTVKKTAKYGDEEAIIGLLRSGYIDYWDDLSEDYKMHMNDFIRKNGSIIGLKGDNYYDAYPNVIFTYTACGIYANKTSNADLTSGISNDNFVMKGGYLNKINCLAAVECGGTGFYPMYADGDLTREDLVEFVLSLQNEDGSFSYKGMEETVTQVTSRAVVALSLTEQSRQVKAAVKSGVEYLENTVKTTDDLKDLSKAIIALNTAGVDATDVNGNDLVKALILRQNSDGSFAQSTKDEGNKDDTAMALLALASRYRFEKGETSLYDMSDVVGGTHNKLSPLWSAYVDTMKVAFAIILTFLVILFIVSRFRIAKWKKEGIYDYEKGRMMSDEDIAKVRARQANRRLQEEKENNGENTENSSENSDRVNAEETEKSEIPRETANEQIEEADKGEEK